MSSSEASIGPMAKLLDRLIADPKARDRAKLELIRLQDEEELQALADGKSVDLWTSRARPSFLYVMYALILWALPMGLIAAFSPTMAAGIGNGMTAYLRGLPEELYALFGTCYLGYTAARTWGKVKGVDR